ncbi:MAG: NAD(P)/FAD-dependent oxidoreductase [Bacillus sp. (in: firmicutes)]
MSKHIVILGAGYGGLLSALSVREYMDKEAARVTVINKYPTHQLITELHRLAAGNVTEERISMQLTKLLKGKDIDLKIAEVTSFTVDNKSIKLSDGSVLTYDALVVGLGSTTAYFGIPGLEENSMVLKSAEDAKKIHRHVERQVKAYADTKNGTDATIVIGGGGLTGVELIGEIADALPAMAIQNGVEASDFKLILVEAGPKIMPMLPDNLIERAVVSLEKRGVTILTGLPITNVDGNIIQLKDGQAISAGTFVWTGGVQGHPLVGQSGLEVNRGRATVNDYLQSTSHDNVFVVGDSAVYFGGNERPYPPTAQLAWQMGDLTGYNLFAYLEGKTMKKFAPNNSGTLASLGRKDAVASIGENNVPLKGLPASIMKEGSNVRYLSHIKGLSALIY